MHSERAKLKSLEQIVREVGAYPPDAYRFIQQGLAYTVNKVHGSPCIPEKKREPSVGRHVSGQELSVGLRDYALSQWGIMAGLVLGRWNITLTLDFGRIVFALVENGHMYKTDQDSIEDFRDVYDFRRAFEPGFKVRQAK